MRDFVMKNQEVLQKKDVDVIYNHFNPWLPKATIKEMKKYVNIMSVTSKTTMLGHTYK